MPDYTLSKEAEKDLRNIARYGIKKFGIEQSRLYRDTLKQRLAEIAQTPLLWSAVDHVNVGYRRSVCRSHAIYYRIEGKEIRIIRILKHQDLAIAF